MKHLAKIGIEKSRDNVSALGIFSTPPFESIDFAK